MLAYLVLIDAPHFPQQHQHVHQGVVVVAEEVIDEARSGITISANCHAFVDAVAVGRKRGRVNINRTQRTNYL